MKKADYHVRLMGLTTRLAGLFHDIGKAGVLFQDGLWSAVEGSRPSSSALLRHELLSYLLLDVDSPDAFMDRLSSPEGVKEAFERRSALLVSDPLVSSLSGVLEAERVLSEVGHLDTDKPDIFISGIRLNHATAWRSDPLWMSLLWLVLTHHRLPNGYWDGQQYVMTFGNHADPESDQRLVDALTTSPQASPWHCSSWCDAVSDVVQQMLALKGRRPVWLDSQVFSNETVFDDKGVGLTSPWVSMVMRFCRLGLIMADHEISTPPHKAAHPKPGLSMCFANSITIDNRVHLADTLENHLCRVGELSESLALTLLRGKETELLAPARLSASTVPKGLRIPAVVKEGRFAWQGHAQQALKPFRRSSGGLFAVVAAGTGRGKTRACAGIMTAMRTSPRFSVLLSMRSLTFQTASSYLGDAVGFHPALVGMLVGDSVLKRRFAGEKGIAAGAKDTSIRASGPEVEVSALDSVRGNHRLADLLATPISVMTIDHVIRATEQFDAKDVLLLSHLLHSDLVLDEVDAYQEKDLVCVGRLIELVAMAGRRVVIASATLPATIVEGLQQAYANGYQARVQCGLAVDRMDTLVITHCAPYVNRCSDGDNFAEMYKRVMGDFCQIAEDEANLSPRRIVTNIEMHMRQLDGPLPWVKRMNVLPGVHRLKEQAQAGFYRASLYYAYRLHAAHAMTSPCGVPYSVGFIRLNSVSAIQRFCDFLLSGQAAGIVPKTVSIKLIAYHAQNIGLVRVLQEQVLEQGLNRSGMDKGEADPWLDHPDTMRCFAQAKTSGCSGGVMFVVVTSSLMETGRDFDFDWAVLEPCSTTSVVQAGGRVRRHREAPVKTANVIMLPCSLNGTFYQELAWRDLVRSPEFIPRADPQWLKEMAPGLEYLGVCASGTIEADPCSAMQGFSRKLMLSKPLHAGHCLSTPLTYKEAPVTVAEQLLKLSAMKGAFAPSGQSHMALDSVCADLGAQLCDGPATEYRFRGDSDSELIRYVPAQQGWFVQENKDQFQNIDHRIYLEFGDTEEADWFYLSALNVPMIEDLVDLGGAVAQDLGFAPYESDLSDQALWSVQVRMGENALTFNPQTGFALQDCREV